MPRISLAAAPDSPRVARQFVLGHLRDWGYGVFPELLDTVALMTSELVTNAVVHVAKPFTVSLSRSREYLRIEVTDLGLAEPVVGPDRKSRPEGGGWGLKFVEELAARWGVDVQADAGKVVWFEVRREDEARMSSSVPDEAEREHRISSVVPPTALQNAVALLTVAMHAGDTDELASLIEEFRDRDDSDELMLAVVSLCRSLCLATSKLIHVIDEHLSTVTADALTDDELLAVALGVVRSYATAAARDAEDPKHLGRPLQERRSGE